MFRILMVIMLVLAFFITGCATMRVKGEQEVVVHEEVVVE